MSAGSSQSISPDPHKSRTAPVIVIGVVVLATLVARRLGYKLGGNVVVRCLKDIARAEEWELRYLSKPACAAFCVLCIPFGGILYLIYGRTR